ncbi:hypothetical protein CR152_31655 [Massilia violaceinigra]|uniref:Uncharacterized protein n=1 Tax=Massilia violaceinigra TaxID=2045208 RepID=A0A2D2DUC5_9BURK|nr:hypothetical protein CR152_31655 [Massilia violaceinigra]
MTNRLFLIDKKYVLWNQSGDCADKRYSLELFGTTPDAKVCSLSDTIAGPKKECSDEKMLPMFNTIVDKTNEEGFGLGAAHVVEEIKFLPANGLSVDFKTIASDTFSGVSEARNVVVRDQAALDALWAEHSRIRIPPPPAPKVNFKTEMVIAVFGGNGSACGSFGVVRANASDGHLVIRTEHRAPDPGVMCIAVVANPMQMITVPRVDAVVDFVQVKTQNIDFTDLWRGPYSHMPTPRNIVIKDATTFATVWNQSHSGGTLPVVDFSKEMVVAVFGQGGPTGCETTEIQSVYRESGKIHVSSVNWSLKPDSGLACPAAISNPGHLVKLPRSNDTVEFSTQSRHR